MDFLYIKALHIIFVVCWFAGLFYIVRLFIYTAEANKKEEPAKSILTEQLLTMQRKLWYIITWPSAIGTTIFGFWMLLEVPAYVALPWMWLKLVFVGFLMIYHIQCHVIFKQQKEGEFKFSSFKLRLFNELATIFLVAIVFLVVVKSTGGFVWGMLGLFAFAGLLMLGVFLYKKQREKKKTEEPATPEIQETSTPENKQ
ncbi:MAG: CopD family protein [Bacteroidetes bacterium]|nr:CopD family protein [Bacteroidota bacterium]